MDEGPLVMYAPRVHGREITEVQESPGEPGNEYDGSMSCAIAAGKCAEFEVLRCCGVCKQLAVHENAE